MPTPTQGPSLLPAHTHIHNGADNAWQWECRSPGAAGVAKAVQARPAGLHLHLGQLQLLLQAINNATAASVNAVVVESLAEVWCVGLCPAAVHTLEAREVPARGWQQQW